MPFASLRRKKVDGMTVSCSEAARLTVAINDAVDAGVPVVCFDSDAPDSENDSPEYGAPMTCRCGQVIVRELAKYMNDTGTIAILAGNEAAPNLQLRVKGRDPWTNSPKHPTALEASG